MRKILLLTALFGFSMVVIPGCGGSEAKVIEAPSSDDGSMAADQQNEYEKQMQQGGSSRSSAPQN